MGPGQARASSAGRVVEGVNGDRFYDREQEIIWTAADRGEAMETVRSRSDLAKSVTT